MRLLSNLGKRPAVAVPVSIGFILVAVLVMYRAGRPTPELSSPQMYFSDDDGATYFLDDVKKVPPFKRGDKEAVRVTLFKGDDGKPFVGYLEKYSPSARAKFEGRSDISGVMESLKPADRLIKAPGGDWLPMNDPKALALRTVKTAKKNRAEPILPPEGNG